MMRKTISICLKLELHSWVPTVSYSLANSKQLLILGAFWINKHNYKVRYLHNRKVVTFIQ